MVVLVIAALVASCGHPGRQSARALRLARPSAVLGFSVRPLCDPVRRLGHGRRMRTRTGSTELLTSHDGGRRWHDVTPPVVLAGENAEIDNPDASQPVS